MEDAGGGCRWRMPVEDAGSAFFFAGSFFLWVERYNEKVIKGNASIRARLYRI